MERCKGWDGAHGNGYYNNMKFKPLAEIVAGKWRADLLVRYVHEIGYCQVMAGTGKKLQSSDISLNCTLWEDYAAKFIKFNNENKETGPIIVMLKYGKINEEGWCLIFVISYCVTVAEVEKVNSTKFGWYYFACFKCGKIAKGDNPPYTCESGHNTETEIVRYKLDLNVSYENTKGTFVMWDREATQLLGISAAQLRTNMIQAGITNRLDYPMLLDGIGEKTYVFKVKWQPKWKTTSVVCYRDADALVNLVKAKFPNAKVIPLLNESVGVDKPNDNTSLTEEVTMSAVSLI
ncbi:putative nucleic acid-binding protein [Medicago truncatula]|uniref:Putative nucleic acid-binding protein n=1 Tax=Medicago truncatula TaxID=3880 RepID=A0A396HVI7_MEDTR|nr:putative nucleic acid-binding protein [Medicago truncatula]